MSSTISAPPSGTPGDKASARRRRLHRGLPRPLTRASRWLRILGPGLITGAADDDPSGIATYSQSGAAYGTGQLWLALYMLPMMIAVQEMCGRIGLVTGQGIAKVVSKHYGRRILFVAMILLVVANTINVGADLGAMVAATRLLIPAPFLALLAFFALGVLALELFIPYHVYAQILKVLALALLAYVITGVIVSPDWGSLLLTTLIPSFSLTPPFLALVVGVLGTTISPYLFFWQAAEEVEETRDQQQEQKKHKGAASRPGLRARIRSLRIDTVLGMLASEVTTWFILMTTGVTLHDAHPPITNITTAAQAAQALTPLVHTFPHAGQLAASIFAIGIIGTGLLAVPVLAGSAAYGVAEALGWSEGLDKPVNQARGFYGVIAAATLVGLLLNLLGVNPIAALVFTAILNGVVAVPLLILIVLVANNRKIMGRWTNNRLSNTIVIITTLFMALAAIFSIVTLF